MSERDKLCNSESAAFNMQSSSTVSYAASILAARTEWTVIFDFYIIRDKA